MENHSPRVSVIPVASEWEVVVSEGDREVAIKFLIEEHARVFADRQRARLGIAPKSNRGSLQGEAGIIATCAM